MTCSVDRKNEGIQFLSRGINPAKGILESDIYLFNGGENFDVNVKFSEKQEDVMQFLNDVENRLEFIDGYLQITDNNIDLETYGKNQLKEESSVLKPKPLYTGHINETLYDSNRVYKGFISGNMADTKTTEIGKLFEPTKAYSTKLENENNKENNNQLKVSEYR